MKNKSRFLAMALTGAMLLAMTGCGEGAASELEKMLSGGFGSDDRLLGVWESTDEGKDKMVLTFYSGNTVICEVNDERKFAEYTLKYEASDPASFPIEMLPEDKREEYQQRIKELNGQWELNIKDADAQKAHEAGNFNVPPAVSAYAPYKITGDTLKFGSHTIDEDKTEKTLVTGLMFSGIGGSTAYYETFKKIGDVPGGGSSGGNGSGTTNPPVEIVQDTGLIGGTWKSAETPTMELVFSADDTVACKIGESSFGGSLKWGTASLGEERDLFIVDAASYDSVKDFFTSGGQSGSLSSNTMASAPYTLSGNTLKFGNANVNVKGLTFDMPPTDNTVYYKTFTKN